MQPGLMSQPAGTQMLRTALNCLLPSGLPLPGHTKLDVSQKGGRKQVAVATLPSLLTHRAANGWQHGWKSPYVL